jgi:hypothetical protein
MAPAERPRRGGPGAMASPLQVAQERQDMEPRPKAVSQVRMRAADRAATAEGQVDRRQDEAAEAV